MLFLITFISPLASRQFSRSKFLWPTLVFYSLLVVVISTLKSSTCPFSSVIVSSVVFCPRPLPFSQTPIRRPNACPFALLVVTFSRPCPLITASMVTTFM